MSDSQSGVGRGRSTQTGFSLVEMMIVVSVLGIITAMSVVTINSSRLGLTGDGAMRVVLAQVNQAHELAITQRRNMRLVFVGTNTIEIKREEVPGGTLTTISSVAFEGRMQYLRPIGSTPENVSMLPASSATPFNDADGNQASEMKFAPDGTFVDQLGRTLNGSVFVALPNDTLSCRAVTILGATGRIRAYRWDGSQWKVV
jgi:prepilin-type N-terminal cleavage/methylation domain-containing protein